MKPNEFFEYLFEHGGEIRLYHPVFTSLTVAGNKFLVSHRNDDDGAEILCETDDIDFALFCLTTGHRQGSDE